MPSITLKNVPEPLLRRLRKVAADEHRSLNQQVISMLESTVDQRGSESAVARAQVEAWRKLAARWKSDVTVEVEARRSRTAGRKVSF